MEQLEGEELDDIEAVELQPVPLTSSVLKEVEAKWLVEMFEYFERNPQIIVHGFLRSGISAALDGELVESNEEGTEESDDSGSSSDESTFDEESEDSSLEESDS